LNRRRDYQTGQKPVVDQRHAGNIAAADGRARGGAAGDGEKLDLAGDHRRHSFGAARKGDQIDIEAVFFEKPGFTRRPERRDIAGERSVACAQPPAFLS